MECLITVKKEILVKTSEPLNKNKKENASHSEKYYNNINLGAIFMN